MSSHNSEIISDTPCLGFTHVLTALWMLTDGGCRASRPLGLLRNTIVIEFFLIAFSRSLTATVSPEIS